MRYLFLIMAMFGASSFAASAQSLSAYGLKDAVIADVGSVEDVRCPLSGDYDCLVWPRNLVKFKGERSLCFQLDGYYLSSIGEDALLLVDKRSALRIMIKSGFGQKYELFDVGRRYECPSLW